MVFFTKIKRNWEPHKMRITARLHLNNKIESFELKKGFMLTIADAEDGAGKSKAI
jgi:hypothetical protein